MVKWNDSNSKQLLLAVIGVLKVGSPPWDEVAAIMGSDFSASAVKQQYQKLQKEAREQVAVGAVEKTESTPIKPRASRKKTTEGAAKARKRKAEDVVKAGKHRAEDVEKDEEEKQDTPVKTEKAEVKSEVEVESDDEV